MFSDEILKGHLDSASAILAASAVQVEWNLNDPENIDRIGNYRYRPTSNGLSRVPIDTYDPYDTAGEYTGATTADVVIEGEYDGSTDPTIFTTVDEKMTSLFSLDDCFQMNRPRSGINKILMLPGKRWLPANNYTDDCPRYYPASKQDIFKYWTSFKNIAPSLEPNASLRYPDGPPPPMSVGISKQGSGSFYIEDACPFVVYKTPINVNRMTLKFQTHVSGTEGAHVFINGVDIGDPTYGYVNQQTPSDWKVQVLKGSVWSDAFVVNSGTTRSDGTPVIGPDGNVDIAYGLNVPEGYRYLGKVTSSDKLPDNPYPKDAYLVATGLEKGFLYLYDEDWTIEPATYDWHLINDNYFNTLPIDDIANMDECYDGVITKYRNLERIQGIRLVVSAMNTLGSTLDLIELSPRMVVGVTDMVESYSIKKALASMDESDLPVGYLIPGTGDISLIDNRSLFSDPSSIFSGFAELNGKFTFYEGADDVDGKVYYVPLKTLYSEGIPPTKDSPPNISFQLRDAFYLFEKAKCPSLFMRDVSLSVAIATLLDYVGFSNYTFRRLDEEEFTIPFFYTNSEKTIAETLQDLARASQTAMFFDEYNNFVVMYRNYLMSNERDVDAVLSGNSQTPHILNIASTEKKRYNDGKVDYNERYIQRSVANLSQASFVNADHTYIYKPVLLWEASGTELVRANNEMGQTQSAFSLAACALNQTLNDVPPFVQSNTIVNNVIDVGESIYWLPRFNGYFHSSGEIIKFDAVEYAVSGLGTVWISSNAEYQKYFADVPFNGKIYPTGRIRIFCEPIIGQNSNGDAIITGIKRHGRAQFQTKITRHDVGLPPDWSAVSARNLIEQESAYLFQNRDLPAVVYLADSGRGKSALASSINVNGIIKNHFRNVQYTEADVSTFTTARAGTLQSSALVLSGPKDPNKVNVNNVSVVSKTLDKPYLKYGARMRVIGEVKSVGDVEQSPTGEMTYYTDAQGVGNVLTGGSGGVAVHYDANSNTGYFLEVIALSNTTLNDSTFDSATDAHNIILYKNMSEQPSNSNAKSIPVKMWGRRANIVVDTGEFVGQGRQAAEDIPNVYDISIETREIGNSLRLFIMMNDQEIGVVDDPNPIPPTNTYALFCRGVSKVMFENTFAMKTKSDQTSMTISETKMIGSESMRRFTTPTSLEQGYKDIISLESAPQTDMYYEEFGAIMRECAYFNIKFDKAFPAMRAKISPMFNKIPSYFVAGFTHDAYGAEFLVFNATDKALNLDETTGNYLRIQGVAFTQNNARSLTMDDYYNEIGSLSDSFTSTMGLVRDPAIAQKEYRDVRIDRRKRGRTEFLLTSDYIQRQDDALTLMKWLVEEMTKPRLLVGLDLFPYPILQLGDLVEIDYTDSNTVEFFAGKQFVVYNIEYERSGSNLSQKVYLAEVGSE